MDSVLTIVPDKRPATDLAFAVEILMRAGFRKDQIFQIGPDPRIEVRGVKEGQRAAIIAALKEAGFAIIEGG